MFQQLKWLYGAAGASFVIALISNQILKTLSDEISIAASHSARGGIFGAVMGIGTGVLGMPGARNKVQNLRERVFPAGKDK
jgi:hypothetical protein